MEHSRLKMTRAHYWNLHSDGYVRVVPEAYLRYELMQRDQRQVTGPAFASSIASTGTRT